MVKYKRGRHITYLHPSGHNHSGWVVPFNLSDKTIARMEAILGCRLTSKQADEPEADERAKRLAGICRELAHLKILKESKLSSQSIKLTLDKISTLSGSDAIEALQKSDSDTQALIQQALVFDLKLTSEEFLKPSGINIQKAAAIVSQNFKPSLEGRNPKTYRKKLAEYVLRLWKELHIKESKIWEGRGKQTPMVDFLILMDSILNIINHKHNEESSIHTQLINPENNEKSPPKLHPSDAVKLLKQAKIQK